VGAHNLPVGRLVEFTDRHGNVAVVDFKTKHPPQWPFFKAASYRILDPYQYRASGEDRAVIEWHDYISFMGIVYSSTLMAITTERGFELVRGSQSHPQPAAGFRWRPRLEQSDNGVHHGIPEGPQLLARQLCVCAT